MAAFTSGEGNDPKADDRKEWTSKVGLYWYYSLILADFNPHIALDVYDNPAHVIAQAFVSKKCYEYFELKKQ